MDFDLDKLARENKVERKEKAKRQLIQSLEIIQNLAWAFLDANEIFPEETFKKFQSNDIWTLIFPFLTDHTDIMNASLTCKSFEDEIRRLPRRISTHRLGGVLRILHDKNYMKMEYEFRDDNDPPEEQIMTEENPILKLRLISKSWKRAVETEFFERPFSSDNWHLSYNEYDPASTRRMRHCSLWGIDQLDQAISTMNGSDSGHCFIRWIRLETASHEQDWIEYWEKLIEFLDVYGPVVWGISFFSCHNYQVLWEVLSRIPNAKALSLKHFSKIDDAELEGFRNLLVEHPFPHAPSLKYLDSCFDVNEHLTAAILKSNGQIKALRLFKCGKNAKNYFHILQNDGGLNLMELERFEGPYYFYHGCDHLSEKWPLKVLYLYQDLNCYRGDSLFPILNRYGDTLIQVSLEDYLIFKGHLIKSGKVKLDLPHLKMLSLHEVNDGNFKSPEYRGNLIELNELVGLKSLEMLKVKTFYPDLTQVLRFFKAFPNLKDVRGRCHELAEEEVYKRWGIKL